MDAQPAQAALSDQPFLVTAQPGSPLAALLDRRDMAQAREAEAKAEAAGLTAEIKNELTLACQGRTKVDIDSPGRERLRLAWRTPKRFSTDDFKTAYTALYESFRRWGTPYWELGPLKRGGRR
jgi:hypothetical protein